jgi:hypothetical protein
MRRSSVLGWKPDGMSRPQLEKTLLRINFTSDPYVISMPRFCQEFFVANNRDRKRIIHCTTKKYKLRHLHGPKVAKAPHPRRQKSRITKGLLHRVIRLLIFLRGGRCQYRGLGVRRSLVPYALRPTPFLIALLQYSNTYATAPLPISRHRQ